MADATVRDGAGQAGEEGRKSGALGMLSGIVIGVASTAPGYIVADIIVMANLAQIASKSTPYKLLHRSPVPVLVVRVPD
jgi:hypothetical protein